MTCIVCSHGKPVSVTCHACVAEGLAVVEAKRKADMTQGRTARPSKIAPRPGDVAPLKRDIPTGDGNYRNRALLDLARGAPCANCDQDDGTVVPAHSNWMEHGKGKSIKAHDCFTADLCGACHAWLDQGGNATDPTGRYQPTKDDKQAMFTRAMHTTWLRRWQAGKLKVVS